MLPPTDELRPFGKFQRIQGFCQLFVDLARIFAHNFRGDGHIFRSVLVLQGARKLHLPHIGDILHLNDRANGRLNRQRSNAVRRVQGIALQGEIKFSARHHADFRLRQIRPEQGISLIGGQTVSGRVLLADFDRNAIRAVLQVAADIGDALYAFKRLRNPLGRRSQLILRRCRNGNFHRAAAGHVVLDQTETASFRRHGLRSDLLNETVQIRSRFEGDEPFGQIAVRLSVHIAANDHIRIRHVSMAAKDFVQAFRFRFHHLRPVPLGISSVANIYL